MHAPRFDTWTRCLARGLSRRTAVGGLAGLGLSAAATRLARAQHNDCTTGDCFGGLPECNPDGSCPEGQYCSLGTCYQCKTHGQTGCGIDADCCGQPGLICNDRGRCVYGLGGGKVKCDGKGCKKKKGH